MSQTAKLFDFYGSANFFQLLLDFFGFCLFYAFLQSLRSVVYNFLRFLQTQAGDFSYNLDNLNLFSANGSQNYVEFALFVSSSSASSTAGNNSNRCGSGYAELFFASFYQFV